MTSSKADVITFGLLLSGQDVEQYITKLQALGVTHILQIGCEPSHQGKFIYCSFPVKDWLFADILQHFDAAFAFIDDARAADGTVLLHCQMGVSRSAAFAAGYLMRTQQLTAAAALAQVRAARFSITPNKGFVCQLLEYEQMCYDVTGWPGWDGDRWQGHPLADAAHALWTQLRSGRPLQDVAKAAASAAASVAASRAALQRQGVDDSSGPCSGPLSGPPAAHLADEQAAAAEEDQ